MKRIWLYFGICSLLACSLPARAGMAPDVLARSTTEEVVHIVTQDAAIKNGNTKKVDALVETEILPHFDFEQMTKMAMARNWRKATPEQQASLVDAFKMLLVHTYAASISSVAQYKLDYKPLRMAADADDVLVKSDVSKPGEAPISLNYRMEKQGNEWKVYDVLVDGVSLVTNYRSSFNSEVRRTGIDGLIKALVNKNRQNSD